MPARHELKQYTEFTEKEAALVDAYTNPENTTKDPYSGKVYRTYRNKVRSYQDAGYYFAGPPEGVEDDGRGYDAAKVAAHKLFNREHIKAEIDRRFQEEADMLKTPMEDLLIKLSEIAEASLMDYLEPVPTCCPHCEEKLPFVLEYQFDIEAMKRDGYGPLLKKLKPTKFGSEFEFYDAAQAMDKLMKHYGGYEKKSSIDASGLGEIIQLARKDTVTISRKS